MRYLNWDVLLFPGSSRVPLQEFNTKCHVLTDLNNRFVDNAALNCNPHLIEAEPVSQIPVLTSFVTSLEHGNPFRISVHSWEAPMPSQILQTFKTLEETVAFEARLYIDGNMIAHRTFDDSAIWPEVIEFTGDAKTIHPKPIRFPVFHAEILDQAHWEPGETYGRIRVVIAEGIVRQTIDGQSRSTFNPLRDVIAFSFQHAPKRILEYSGIAWPNARLFRQGLRSFRDNPANRDTLLPDFELHAHSPQRRHQQAMATLYEPDSSVSQVKDERMSRMPAFDDPFIGPRHVPVEGHETHARNNSTEISKDFNSIRTARSHAGTDMSGVSYEKPDFERAMNEAAIEEIVKALSPERRSHLFQALSPVKQSQISMMNSFLDGHHSVEKVLYHFDEPDLTSSPSPALPRNGTGQGPARYSSAPNFRTSNIQSGQAPSHLVGKPADLIIGPSPQELTPNRSDRSSERAKSSNEVGSRSSSTTSRRKRKEPSSVKASGGLFAMSGMLISPSKSGNSTHAGLVNEIVACNAGSLDRSKV